MKNNEAITWDNVPHTDDKATVTETRPVIDVMVIEVANARIRNATVNGTFEVADVANPFRLDNGVLKVEVKCHWYGLQPKDAWMHLTIPNKYQFIRRFTGEVADNIAR
jgi:hypothetical protein